MIKTIDLDALFDKYIEDYVYKNIGKVKPEEIENKMPILYTEFGDKALKELDGKTPNQFYKDFQTEELLKCLKNHIEEGVSVSDFLYEAIVSKKDGAECLRKELLEDNGEEYTAYLINLLEDVKGEIPAERYLDFILYDYPESISELATESLGASAEIVKESILKEFRQTTEDKKAKLIDVLSNCKNDDRVFDLLVEEFVKHTDNYPLYASYLSKYGDERALPFLMTAIEGEKISYADFEELRFAIEALGGEYTKSRDFSKEKTYKKIINAGRKDK